MNKLRTIIIKYALVLLFSFFIVLIVLSYNNTLTDRLQKYVFKTVDEIVYHQLHNFKYQVDMDVKILDKISEMLSDSNWTIDDVISHLDDIKNQTNFEEIYLVNNSGECLTNQNCHQKIDSMISDIGDSMSVIDINISDDKLKAEIVLASPFYDNFDQIIGYIIGDYAIDRTGDIVKPSFNGYGNLYLLDKFGDVVYTTLPKERLDAYSDIELWEFFDGIKADGHSTNISVYDQIKQGIAGSITYSDNNRDYYLQYLPIDIDGWTLLFVIDQNILYSEINKVIGGSKASSYVITAILILLIFILFYIQKRQIDDLNNIAYTDKLTKLGNRDRFVRDIAIINSKYNATSYACIILDVNDLKSINDGYGTDVGNSALLVVAKSIEQAFKHHADDYSIARLYGDLFGIYLPYKNASTCIEKILLFTKSNVASDAVINGIKIDYAIGLYVAQVDDDAQTIIERASITKDISKKGKLNELLEYQSSFSNSLKTSAMVRNNAQTALKNDEFEMFLQPKISTKTGKLCGAEALSRWKIQDVYLSPAVFISELEKNRIIIELDLFMFNKSCQYLAKLRDEHKALIPISINFSRHHLGVDGFVAKLNSIRDKYQIEAKYLIIEFTESIMISNHVQMRKIIEELKFNGYITSMDDFGSGYSSFGLLDDVMFNEIKLDKCLIDHIRNDNRAEAIVRNIINMAKDLGVCVVAEGVETDIQFSILELLNCDIIQGYLFGKPMPLESFDEYYKNNI